MAENKNISPEEMEEEILENEEINDTAEEETVLHADLGSKSANQGK